ncbi:MAG: adenylosuccinate lyase [Bacteroidales bacterium]
MKLSPLTAISPVDGRYRQKTSALAAYFSEYALMKYRVRVEVEYLIALAAIPLPQLDGFNKKKISQLRNLYWKFSLQDAERIKEIEKNTNHDVKAVEYFLREKLKEAGMEQATGFVHFGLTSQDVNNTAIPLSLKEAMQEVYRPALRKLIDRLRNLADKYAGVAMLARTHGQPASPTRLGKEIQVFVERLEKQVDLLDQVPFSAKFGGATGNFNAHRAAYPSVNWVEFANRLVNDVMGLQRSQTTTQIDHYDHLAALCDALKRINTVMIDLDRDMWSYISMDYFRQKIKKGEVGSSTMPHKVNPIDFENSEGNLGMANAVFAFLSAKLPVSRLQRDLTDSTVLRNIGVPLAHTLIAIESTIKGLARLQLNAEAVREDLDRNWSVVAEAIQTVLRREGYDDPYEKLKELTRTHRRITRETIHRFIDSLDVREEVKAELKRIEPGNYTGY